MSSPVAYIGIDVATRPRSAPWRTPNSEAGLAELVPRLQTLTAALIVLETIGGVALLVVAALAAAGLPVAVVNPRQVRAFGTAIGQLANTDGLDARVLARFAEAVRPTPRPLPDADTQALAVLVARHQVIAC